jgi:hypothetical protein
MPSWTSFLREAPYFPKPRPGDWLVIALGMALVGLLFATLWHPGHAAKLRVRNHNGIFATYSLTQDRTIDIAGPLGNSQIVIQHGQVRFRLSPCHNQYCVHQGWLSHPGQVAICLPNQVSIELLGGEKSYDSLNY